MRKSIQKLSTLLLALYLVIGMIPASVMASADPTVSYCTHVQNEGWQDYKSNGVMSGTEGKSYRLEGIKVKLDTQGYDLGISYQTHIQNIGWEADTDIGWKGNDVMSGTEGMGYRLEAIQIKLTGTDASKFDIYYQVHAQNIGWMGWAKNGESAGTAGFGYRLEGIRIVIVQAGSGAPGSTENVFKENTEQAYKIAYEALLEQAYQDYVNNLPTYFNSRYACPYSLFDMDSNGIPELFIKRGYDEAGFRYDIYTFTDGKANIITTINGSHGNLFGRTSSTNGGLILLKAHMGYQQVYELTYVDGLITSTLILSGEAPNDAYYTTDYRVPTAHAYDFSLLNSF